MQSPQSSTARIFSRWAPIQLYHFAVHVCGSTGSYGWLVRSAFRRTNRLSWISIDNVMTSVVVQRPETVSDVSLNEPGRRGPGIRDLPQRAMTALPWPESVGPIGERRLVVRLQQQAHHLTDEFSSRLCGAPT